MAMGVLIEYAAQRQASRPDVLIAEELVEVDGLGAAHEEMRCSWGELGID